MRKYICILVVLPLIFSACGDDFLELTPNSDASSDNFFQNAGDIETATTGIYSELQDAGYYGDFWRQLGEYRSDNIDVQNVLFLAGRDTEINEFRESASNEVIESGWKAIQRVIFAANLVLDRIETVTIDNDSKTLFQAEARFLRALSYFNLVRLWGEVPLLTSPLEPEEVRSNAQRDAVSDIYGTIVEDLIFAQSNLPGSNGASGRATQNAAHALLAKVYITQGRHSDAIPALRNVDVSTLIPLSEVWGYQDELNDEMIFLVRFRADISTQSHTAWYDTNGDPLISDNLRQAYVDAGDTNRGALLESNNDLGGDPIPLKFQEEPFGGGSYGRDYPVLRKADVALMLAESLNEGGYVADGEAFDLLNRVRSRAGLPAYTSTDLADQGAFRDAIFLERRLEFALEGHRWYDLKRSGKATTALMDVGITFQDFQLLYPLPQTEIDAFQDETRFPQNIGY